ncbi:MAG: GNAT family N-acetyltransferase [Candidatus Micrarchaeaceae archaeon]
MEVRVLDSVDLPALSEFIIETYNDYPLATWFEQEPSPGEIERVFYNKLGGIGSRTLIDIVIADNGTIAGECEVVKIDHDKGVVGIMVRKGYRSRHMGRDMLKLALDGAKGIGISKFTAEVAEENPGALRFFINNGFIPAGHRDIERGKEDHRLVILHCEA